MKKAIVTWFAVILGLSASLSRAGVLIGTGLFDGAGGDTLVIGPAGIPLLPGSSIASVGCFTISDAQVAVLAGNLSYDQLIGSFVSIASDDFNAGSIGHFGSAIPGLYVVSTDYGLVGSGDPRVGKTLYTFLGNAATLEASNALALVQHVGQTIDQDDNVPIPDSNNLGLWYPFHLMLGSVGPGVFYDATVVLGVHSPNTPAKSIRLDSTSTSLEPEAMPEPFFGGIAVMFCCLLMRRHRNPALF